MTETHQLLRTSWRRHCVTVWPPGAMTFILPSQNPWHPPTVFWVILKVWDETEQAFLIVDLADWTHTLTSEPHMCMCDMTTSLGHWRQHLHSWMCYMIHNRWVSHPSSRASNFRCLCGICIETEPPALPTTLSPRFSSDWCVASQIQRREYADVCWRICWHMLTYAEAIIEKRLKCPRYCKENTTWGPHEEIGGTSLFPFCFSSRLNRIGMYTTALKGYVP